MMSPYEGERIFEAEMVRLHQCDRSLYACAPEVRSQPRATSSILTWLTTRLTAIGAQARVSSTSSAPHASANNSHR